MAPKSPQEVGANPRSAGTIIRGETVTPIRLALSFALIAGSARSRADWHWEVVLLQPEGANASQVLGADGRVQGGWLSLPSETAHPVIWNGTGSEYVDLLPAIGFAGKVEGVDGEYQVGWVNTSTIGIRGLLWNGSAQSFVDLTPPSPYGNANLLAVRGGQQVGMLGRSGVGMVAGLWQGTTQSFVDLQPDLAVWGDSAAVATDGLRQAGGVIHRATGYPHAALWHGTAASFVDLHPSDGLSSGISGMAGDVQVGRVRFGPYEQAALWRGTAESVTYLHPTGATLSELYCTTGRVHGGLVYFGAAHAAVWTSDDSNSYQDLHTYLGTGWSTSLIQAISEENGRVYASGFARRGPREEAVLWIGRRINHDAAQPCSAAGCTADLTADCIVGLDDLTQLLAAFGTTAGDPAWNAAADFDRDGAVGLGDLARLLAQFGNDCE